VKRWSWMLVAMAWVVPVLVFAEESAPEVPEKGICTVCARRGATHGEEDVVAWRQSRAAVYTFCSEPCGEAFDQMPEGYATPILPRPAPEVSLVDADGNALGPIASAGPTLIDFWATWCKPCLEMMPTLSRLHEEGRVRVIGVSIDEDAGALRKFLRRKAPSYPVAHDTGDDPAWWAYRVPAIPAAFLLDGEGQVVAQWGADFTEEALLEALGSPGTGDR